MGTNTSFILSVYKIRLDITSIVCKWLTYRSFIFNDCMHIHIIYIYIYTYICMIFLSSRFL